MELRSGEVLEDAFITPQSRGPIQTTSLNELVFSLQAPDLLCLCLLLHPVKMYATRALRMPILKRSSYYESDYRQSPALIRARRPYLVKNAVTGFAIMSFAIGVCEYRGHLAGASDSAQSFSR